AATSVTTRRHIRDVSSTFALSTEVTLRRRPRAIANARCAMRSTWLGAHWRGAVAHGLDLVGVVLERVEHRSVVAGALRAVVEAADQLADDHQVDRPLPGRAQVPVARERLSKP